MPPKNNIELGNGYLYLSSLDEPLEVFDGEIEYEPEYAEDQEPYIKMSQEPIEFTFDNVEFTKNWTMVKCEECGYQFPVSDLYALLYGTEGWICPGCKFKRIVEEARKRSKYA